MATAVARHALYLPGRLIMNPTDFSAAAPYGGTRLGLTRLRLRSSRASDRLLRVGRLSHSGWLLGSRGLFGNHLCFTEASPNTES